MTARRTNKKRPLRQTTGEKFPAAVVNAQADTTDQATTPAPADAPAGKPAAASAVEEAIMDTPADTKPTAATPSPEAARETEAAPTEAAESEASPAEATARAAVPNQPEPAVPVEPATPTGPATTTESEPTSGPAARPASPVPEPAAQMEPAAAEEPASATEPAAPNAPATPTETAAPTAPAPAPRPARPARRQTKKPAAPELVIAPATEHVEAQGAILMSASAQVAALKACGTAADMIATARAAGALAGKRTGDEVPSCPARTVTTCQVSVRPIAPAGEEGLKGWEPAREDGRCGFAVRAAVDGCDAGAAQTSALSAVCTAQLTLFDLLKGEDPAIELAGLRLAGAEPHEAPAPAAAPTAEPDEPAAPASPLPGGAGTGTPAPAIAFIGYQNAGKTTLVERVIAKLSGRGLRVGSIKLHGPKGFDIDQPGKDSWRHAQAGSRHVGLISPDQYAEYSSTEQEVPVADLLTHFTDVDVVVVEGYKTTGIPSIVVARSGVDRIRGTNSYELVDADTLAVACNDVTARGFRAQWGKMAEEAGEQPNATAPVPLPSFLDINDVPEIVSFVVDSLDLGKK